MIRDSNKKIDSPTLRLYCLEITGHQTELFLGLNFDELIDNFSELKAR